MNTDRQLKIEADQRLSSCGDKFFPFFILIGMTAALLSPFGIGAVIYSQQDTELRIMAMTLLSGLFILGLLPSYLYYRRNKHRDWLRSNGALVHVRIIEAKVDWGTRFPIYWVTTAGMPANGKGRQFGPDPVWLNHDSFFFIFKEDPGVLIGMELKIYFDQENPTKYFIDL